MDPSWNAGNYGYGYGQYYQQGYDTTGQYTTANQYTMEQYTTGVGGYDANVMAQYNATMGYDPAGQVYAGGYNPTGGYGSVQQHYDGSYAGYGNPQSNNLFSSFANAPVIGTTNPMDVAAGACEGAVAIFAPAATHGAMVPGEYPRGPPGAYPAVVRNLGNVKARIKPQPKVKKASIEIIMTRRTNMGKANEELSPPPPPPPKVSPPPPPPPLRQEPTSLSSPPTPTKSRWGMTERKGTVQKTPEVESAAPSAASPEAMAKPGNEASMAVPGPSKEEEAEEESEDEEEEEEKQPMRKGKSRKLTFEEKKMGSLSALLSMFEGSEKKPDEKDNMDVEEEEEEEEEAEEEEEEEEEVVKKQQKNIVTFEEKMAGSLTALLGMVTGEPTPTAPPVKKKYPKPSKGPTTVPPETSEALTYPFGTAFPVNLAGFGMSVMTDKPKPEKRTSKENRAKYHEEKLKHAKKDWNWLGVRNAFTKNTEGAAFTTGQGGGADSQPGTAQPGSGLTASGKDKSEVNFFYKVPREAYSCPEDLKGVNKRKAARLQVLVRLRYCKLCSVVFPNTFSAKQHYEGKRHYVKLRTYIQSSERKDEAGNPMCCKVCNVIYSDEHHKAVHLKGKPHAKRVLTLKQRGIIPFDAPVDDPMVKGPAFKDESDDEDNLTLGDAKVWNMKVIDNTDNLCPICSIGFSSVLSALQHYRGKMHDKKLNYASTQRKLDTDDVIVKGAEDRVYECIICSATLNSRESLNEHIVGYKHQTKLKARQQFAVKGKDGGGRGAMRGGRGTMVRGRGRGGVAYSGLLQGGKAGIITPRGAAGGGQWGRGGRGQGYAGRGQVHGRHPVLGQGSQETQGPYQFAQAQGLGKKRQYQQDDGSFNKYAQFIQFQPASKKFQTHDGLVVMGPQSYSHF